MQDRESDFRDTVELVTSGTGSPETASAVDHVLPTARKVMG